MDGLERSARNALTALALDRAPMMRSDPDWLEQQRRHAHVIPVWQDKGLLSHEQSRLVSCPVEPDSALDSLIFLGLDGDQPWFTLPVGEAAGAALAERLDAEWLGLRRACMLLPHREAGLLAYARALILWHENAQYCGRCGAPTQSRDGGFMRVCTHAACGLEQFPRLNPAVIMRVEFEDRILLGREARWPEGQYSVLAGFVEPGESLEDAVRREVAEESGVSLTRVDYQSSQPWPFPASLMVGFSAQAADNQARPLDELEAVRWLGREELTQQLLNGQIRVSSPLSISHRLIDDWLDPRGGRLAALQTEFASRCAG